MRTVMQIEDKDGGISIHHAQPCRSGRGMETPNELGVEGLRSGTPAFIVHDMREGGGRDWG
jgi:hypothetical protein